MKKADISPWWQGNNPADGYAVEQDGSAPDVKKYQTDYPGVNKSEQDTGGGVPTFNFSTDNSQGVPGDVSTVTDDRHSFKLSNKKDWEGANPTAKWMALNEALGDEIADKYWDKDFDELPEDFKKVADSEVVRGGMYEYDVPEFADKAQFTIVQINGDIVTVIDDYDQRVNLPKQILDLDLQQGKLKKISRMEKNKMNTLHSLVRKANRLIKQASRSKNHGYAGKLIVLEGLDGAGKSTQIELLKGYLERLGHQVVITRWNSAKGISKVVKDSKKDKTLKPSTGALLCAADLAERLNTEVIPALREGKVVLCDRYFYTALARDSVRGMDQNWLRKLYAFTVDPDCVFYCRLPVMDAVARVLTRNSGKLELSDTPDTQPLLQVQPKHYEAGLDLQLAQNPIENFCMFQTKVSGEYDKQAREFGFNVVDASGSVEGQHSQIVQVVACLFDKVANDPVKKKLDYHGVPIDIEWPKGSVRHYKNSDFETKMKCDYGYIRKTEGEDGEDIDCYVGPNHASEKVWKIEQLKEDGSYDEDKFMLGFDKEDDAKYMYIAHMGEKKFGNIVEVPWEKFMETIRLNKTAEEFTKKDEEKAEEYLQDIGWMAPEQKPVKKEAEPLMDLIDHDSQGNFLEVGDSVRLKTGPHNGSLGQLVAIDGNKVRVSIGDATDVFCGKQDVTLAKKASWDKADEQAAEQHLEEIGWAAPGGTQRDEKEVEPGMVKEEGWLPHLGEIYRGRVGDRDIEVKVVGIECKGADLTIETECTETGEKKYWTKEDWMNPMYGFTKISERFLVGGVEDTPEVEVTANFEDEFVPSGRLIASKQEKKAYKYNEPGSVRVVVTKPFEAEDENANTKSFGIGEEVVVVEAYPDFYAFNWEGNEFYAPLEVIDASTEKLGKFADGTDDWQGENNPELEAAQKTKKAENLKVTKGFEGIGWYAKDKTTGELLFGPKEDRMEIEKEISPEFESKYEVVYVQ